MRTRLNFGGWQSQHGLFELNPSPHFVPRLLAARQELPLITDAGGLPTRCSATDPQSKRTERCASIPPLVLLRGRAPQNFPAKTRQQERNHFTDCSEGSVRHPSISRQKLEQQRFQLLAC